MHTLGFMHLHIGYFRLYDCTYDVLYTLLHCYMSQCVVKPLQVPDRSTHKTVIFYILYFNPLSPHDAVKHHLNP